MKLMWKSRGFKAVYILLLIGVLLNLSACTTTTSSPDIDNDENVEVENPLVTIEMEDGGTIEIELYPDTAPNTVNNFISLIGDGYYDGLIFHRVIPGFMIQGGDPDGNGTGDPGYAIEGEFSSNGFENNLLHERGVISMARSMDPNSAGSQFFIMVSESPHLDGDYAAFGRVINGMEVVDRIVASERNQMDKPTEDQIMKTVTVETFNIDYDSPEIIQ
ncbi:peptidyl-prolyl cis-trans isomerase B (cyclophilin B) [Natronincola peptidivorans]|uniref:Peptidyl-prolyl cis-trans isomerase n=2 Tax=Natronincola peptidivorans TaxID=426128 RepID=A0A1I0F2X4_9FIRM|nr:peptidylprolyl isomerase [Natronincola peptidivorans]SET52182.1 peptidyl-prolyl cis-trans isomerase B (cyclophilin B) [Natronincola peptidivorans]